MTRKFLIATALVVLASAAGLATVAAAEKPIKEPVPAGDFIVPAGEACEDFSVLIHPTVNKEFQLTFGSGVALFAGQLKIEVTNLDSDKTIRLNASGPGSFSSDGTTVTLRGATLLFGTFPFGGEPRLSLVGGVVKVDLATNAILSERGHSRDLCPILADP
jgi:hypothetical protein